MLASEVSCFGTQVLVGRHGGMSDCLSSLPARQEEKEVKRIKLEYDEIGSCVREVMEVWDLLDSKENRFNARCDNPMLIQAIRQG